MPELRRDPITGRWVIISTDRQKRPNDFRVERFAMLGREQCPFCPGREAMTPPEVLAYRQNGSAANTPGWDLRVVPNKFPALQVEGTLDREGEGLFDRMNGIGAHEVIIETPDHDRPFAAMSEPEIERVLWAYRERMLDLKKDFRLKQILVFKNHGAAAEAVTPLKQLRMARLASEYLVRHHVPECACRFDVVAIQFDDGDDRTPDIQVIQNAFDA